MIFTEGRHPAEFILSEGEHFYSRDTPLVVSEQRLEPGTILARGAGIFLVPWEADGMSLPVAITYNFVGASADGVRAVVIARHAAVSSANIAWPAGATAQAKAEAAYDLRKVGIVIRG